MNAIDLGAGTAFLGRNALFFDELDSTNGWCKRNDLPHGTAVLAASQTSGRGRMGQSWSDSPGKSLSFSLVLRDWPANRLAALPLACCIGVLRALTAECGPGFAVKWSNDLLHGEKKVCGILCESVLSGGSATVVIGIGVNLTRTEQEFKSLGLVYAASLESATGKKIDGRELAAAICRELEPVLIKFQEFGFLELREEYRRSCLTLGKEVRVIQNGRELAGLAVDIGGDGGLICEIGGERVIIHAGEASVRGLYGYV